MGAVYEGEHTGTGRRVAIKVISSGDVSHDKKLVARFQREAKAAGSIDTQHITQVLDAGTDETGSPYLVMELLHGEDLQSAIRRLGPLPVEVALRIVAQTCLGLQKAHDAGVVHRDIKPANLFLARRDAGEVTVKLLDFGVAKVKMDHASDTDNMALTKTGSMLGSPLYMSPEQAKGLKTIDHRADLWSLGVVLYQALTGKTPYDHCDALGGLIIAICHEDVAPVEELAPWVPDEVGAIIARALQRDPAARFQSAQEMFDAIRPLIPGWSVNLDMLMPLSETAKTAVPPRRSMPPKVKAPSMPPPPGPSLAPRSLPPPPGRSLPPPPGEAPIVPAKTAQATTTAALVHSQEGDASAPRAGRSPAMIAAFVAAAGLVGAGAWFVTSNKPPPVPVPATTPVVTADPAPVPAPVVTAAATDTTRVEPRAPKRVKIVILPEEASAEVEGVKTPLRSGVLEITGPPGAVRRVRVWKGKLEATVDVIITEAGAVPPKIELTPAKAP